MSKIPYETYTQDTLAAQYADLVEMVQEIDEQREADDENFCEHKISSEMLIKEIKRLRGYIAETGRQKAERAKAGSIS